MDKTALLKIFQENVKDPQWCPGCGDFGELNVLAKTLAKLAMEDETLHEKASFEVPETLSTLGLTDTKICLSCSYRHFYPRYLPHNIVTDSGIGCAGQMLSYLNTYGAKTPHGRVLPFALGLKLIRPDLTVIPQGGDGDAFAIGAGHFVNFGGQNVDITYLVTNNEVYGLTKGQVSPSSQADLKTSVNPHGSFRQPLNPSALAIASGWTFVARLVNVGKTKDGLDTSQLAVEVTAEAIRHRGSSIVIFETACPTYNKMKTKEWLAERAVAVPQDHDPASQEAAMLIALIPEEQKIPVGIYYRDEKQPTLNEQLGITNPLLNLKPNTIRLQELLRQFS